MDEVRPIIRNGNIIGEITFPEGTSEEMWTFAMNAYKPKLIDPEMHVAKIIRNNMRFGNDLMAEFGAKNVLSDIPNSDTIELVRRLADLQGLIKTGSLDTAYTYIASLPEDEYVTPEVKEFFMTKIQAHLLAS